MPLAETVDRICQDIKRHAAGRAVALVAISKRQPVTAMQEYLAVATTLGLPVIFGENYVQELSLKRTQLQGEAEWHLTGPLQSNKIAEAVRVADVIQSVHSTKVIDGIAKAAKRLGKRQQIFLQVNIGRDPNKRGFLLEELQSAIERCHAHCAQLSLCGLMTITPLYEESQFVERDFQEMNRIRCAIQESSEAAFFCNSSVQLSMGMSADYQMALQAGADLIRVGSLLFGNRS